MVLKLERIARDAERARARGDTSSSASAFSGAAQFEREGQVLGKYRHPNIVALLGTASLPQAEGAALRPCLVYEFMAGQSLKARLRPKAGRPGEAGRAPALTPRERFAIASDVARGLAFLHTMASPPIIHQDIKTDNIMLGAAPAPASAPAPGDVALVAKIVDFGTVRMAPELAQAGTDAATHHSTMNVVGTGPYMPLEYAMCGRVSAKTDTYAFGVVLLELLTGRPPFNRPSRMLLAEELGAEVEQPQRLFAPHLDSAAGEWRGRELKTALRLAAVVARCVASERSRCVAADVVDELDALAGRGRGDGGGDGRGGTCRRGRSRGFTLKSRT